MTMSSSGTLYALIRGDNKSTLRDSVVLRCSKLKSFLNNIVIQSCNRLAEFTGIFYLEPNKKEWGVVHQKYEMTPEYNLVKLFYLKDQCDASFPTYYLGIQQPIKLKYFLMASKNGIFLVGDESQRFKCA